MPKFTLTIDCGSAAFDDYGCGHELGAILDRVSARMVDRTAAMLRAEGSVPVRDTNGNRVGEWKIEE